MTCDIYTVCVKWHNRHEKTIRVPASGFYEAGLLALAIVDCDASGAVVDIELGASLRSGFATRDAHGWSLGRVVGETLVGDEEQYKTYSVRLKWRECDDTHSIVATSRRAAVHMACREHCRATEAQAFVDGIRFVARYLGGAWWIRRVERSPGWYWVKTPAAGQEVGELTLRCCGKFQLETLNECFIEEDHPEWSSIVWGDKIPEPEPEAL